MGSIPFHLSAVRCSLTRNGARWAVLALSELVTAHSCSTQKCRPRLASSMHITCLCLLISYCTLKEKTNYSLSIFLDRRETWRKWETPGEGDNLYCFISFSPLGVLFLPAGTEKSYHGTWHRTVIEFFSCILIYSCSLPSGIIYLICDG